MKDGLCRVRFPAVPGPVVADVVVTTPMEEVSCKASVRTPNNTDREESNSLPGASGRNFDVGQGGMSLKLFSVDAETDGLYGEIFAIGAVVCDEQGRIVDQFAGRIEVDLEDEWVSANIEPMVAHLPVFVPAVNLFARFWQFWMEHRDDSICMADFGAPVEAYLFRKCVEMDPEERVWQGPYPMHELGTALLLDVEDPDVNRREYCELEGLVQHNPLHDAVMAGACWFKATCTTYEWLNIKINLERSIKETVLGVK